MARFKEASPISPSPSDEMRQLDEQHRNERVTGARREKERAI